MTNIGNNYVSGIELISRPTFKIRLDEYKDAQLIQSKPDNSYGNLDSILLTNSSLGEAMGIFGFKNLKDIKPNFTALHRATLVLTQDTPSSKMHVLKVLEYKESDWLENYITWNFVHAVDFRIGKQITEHIVKPNTTTIEIDITDHFYEMMVRQDKDRFDIIVTSDDTFADSPISIFSREGSTILAPHIDLTFFKDDRYVVAKSVDAEIQVVGKSIDDIDGLLYADRINVEDIPSVDGELEITAKTVFEETYTGEGAEE